MNPVDTYTLLTFSVSDVPAQACRNALREILNREDEKWRFEEKDLSLGDIYSDMPPRGGRHLPKLVIWEPCLMGGTVIFCNRICGWPLLTRALSRTFSEPFIHVRITNNVFVHPVYSLGYWVRGRDERCVQLLKDGRWQFFQKGPLLPFENSEYYQRRKITERLSKEIIVEYLRRLGWDIGESRFWQSDAPAFYGHKLRH